MNGLSYQIL